MSRAAPSASAPERIEDRLARSGGALELLRVPAALFGALVRARRAAYDRGWLSTTRLPVPVVCVGNLTAGGTGKTPLVAWVVRALMARGFRPGILSRGYGAAKGEPNDEARLLAELCPGVPHVQDVERARGGAALVAQGCDAVVLDDGFQHRKLARDVDLVLVDATRPWGLAADERGRAVKALLPRGLLREPPSSLARAHALVITRCDAVPAAELASLERELLVHAPGRGVALARHAPRAWIDERGTTSALAALRGKRVDVVSAIGNPAAFERTLVGLGVELAEVRRFPDHHRYVEADLEGLGGLGAEGRVLVTTQKDAVKLAPLGARFQALAIETEFARDAGVLEALLDALPRAGERVVKLPSRRKLRD
ncbi:MAG: tetraacyldisaccharide 4'-kinase [Planctomycetes bacterium]|nr:tetraacyldisaccharide 4'-kinase [Planctomycetota bacterium]